jgi:hypothetical protein
MVRIAIAGAIVGVLVLAGMRVSQPQAAGTACGSYSIGPGAVVHGNARGARCLLSAYRDHCRPARYRLSIFGVDTIATRDFSVVTRDARCEVAVASSFRVVPQPAHSTGRSFCRTLRPVGTSILAQGCKGGGLPSTVSLTTI